MRSRRLLNEKAYQGNLTDQFRKIAARLNSVTSVTTALPFSNSNPPIAGSNANASGTECQCEGSCPVSTSGLFALGRKRLSVVVLIDCPASLTESEKLEVRELER